MNRKLKIILGAYAAALVLAIMFPPYSRYGSVSFKHISGDAYYIGYERMDLAWLAVIGGVILLALVTAGFVVVTDLAKKSN